jgi:anaerobic magnesium-protoporphyrin IX monomethyl ester cyclase
MARNHSKLIHLVSFAAEYRGIEDLSIPPVGCLYVGNALKIAGFEVKIHHLSSSILKDAAKEIAQSKPLLVGFSVITGSPVKHSATMSMTIKSISSDIPIVWGGIHPSLMPEACVKEKFIDFVIRGEGEITVVNLAHRIQERLAFDDIPGLCWKGPQGEIQINEDCPFIRDLDQYEQDWTLLDPGRYVRTALDGTRYLSYITSRGCPHNCGFCYNLVFNKRRWRAHSVDHAVERITRLCRITNTRAVVFYDDNFLVDESRAFQILERLQQVGIRVLWLEVRLDRINDRVLDKLSKYEVRTLFVGWESGSNRTLRKIDKGFNTSLILEGFKLAGKYSLEVDASAIVGFPFETAADWVETMRMALEIDSINPGANKFNIGVYVPYPGTPIARQAVEKGFQFPQDIMAWDSFDILKGEMRLPWLSPGQVRRFALIDRYAKMLYTGGSGNRLVKMVRTFFAELARLRMKSNSWFMPFEAYLYDRIVVLYLKYRMASLAEK